MQTKTSKVYSNTLFSLLARGTELAASFLTIILAARYLGVEAFGEFAFVRAIAYVCTPLISFGTLRILIRDISVDKGKTSPLVCSGLAINLITGLALITIGAVFPVFFSYKPVFFPVYVFSVSMAAQLFMTMLKTISSVFIAYEKIYFDLIVIIFSSLLTILFLWAVVFFKMPGVFFFYALGLANLMGFFVSISLMRLKLVPLVWMTSFKRISDLVIHSFPLMIAIFMTEGYNNIFVFFLKLFRGPAEVSFFQAPQRVIQQSLVVPRSFFFAYVPLLSRMAAQSQPEAPLKRAASVILKYIFILTLPACMGVTVFADHLILAAFGPEFLDSAKALQVLIWAINLLFVNVLLDHILTSTKRQNLLTVSNGLCLVISSVAGFLLICEYGYLGACWATLISYGVLVASNLYFVSRHLGGLPLYRIAAKPVLACIMPGMMLMKFSGEIDGILLIAGGLFSYSALLFLFQTFTKEELRLFKQVLSSKWSKCLK